MTSEIERTSLTCIGCDQWEEQPADSPRHKFEMFAFSPKDELYFCNECGHAAREGKDLVFEIATALNDAVAALKAINTNALPDDAAWHSMYATCTHVLSVRDTMCLETMKFMLEQLQIHDGVLQAPRLCVDRCVSLINELLLERFDENVCNCRL